MLTMRDAASNSYPACEQRPHNIHHVFRYTNDTISQNLIKLVYPIEVAQYLLLELLANPPKLQQPYFSLN